MSIENKFYKASKREELSARGMHPDEYSKISSELRGFKMGYKIAKKELKQQLKQKDELIREMNNLLDRVTRAYADEEIKEIDLEINQLISRPEIQAIINNDKE